MSIPRGHAALLETMEAHAAQVRLGGGEAKLAKLAAGGKLGARDRLKALLDPGTTIFELGLFAGFGLYEAHGGCPSGGVVVVIGEVSGQLSMVIANDPTIKAGAWFPIGAKKNLRAQEMALSHALPVIYLVDSAGVYLPMQDEVFADRDHFGRQFRNNARLSASGIVQVAAIMGACVAGGAYLPAMCDEALIVEGNGSLFLAGSYLVKAAIGEDVDQETLGGSVTHTAISGVVDQQYPDELSCLRAVREIFGRLPVLPAAGFPTTEAKRPLVAEEEIYDRFPLDRNTPYDIREVLACVVDEGSMSAYKPAYGNTLFCAYACIGGFQVGIVANQRLMVRTTQGEYQMGGVIYSDAADKAARFIMNCNQRHVPLLFFQDVNGFMIGKRAEHGGIIKDGAKMVNAMANSVVPKITIVMGNSYGAGNYAMCGRAYDPSFMLAWPTAAIGVMSGKSAAQTLLQIKSAQAKQKLSAAEKKQILEDITQQYNDTLSPYYAAARLWVDAIIAPHTTRETLVQALRVCTRVPITAPFRTGVLQT